MLSHGLLTACLLDSSVESGLNDWEEVLQLFFFGEDQNDEKVEREKTQETNCRRKKKKDMRKYWFKKSKPVKQKQTECWTLKKKNQRESKRCQRWEEEAVSDMWGCLSHLIPS